MTVDDATILSLRRDLATQLSRVARRPEETQAMAAKRLGIPQPTLSKIANGRIADLSIEFLLRVAVRAGVPVTLQTGSDASQAGAFRSGLVRPRPREYGSELAQNAREALLQSERSRTASERLAAFLEHNQLIGALHQAGRALQRRIPGSAGAS